MATDELQTVTLRVTVRAEELALKDAAARLIGGGEDPDAAKQRSLLRDALGLPAIDDQTWPAISAVTATGQSAYQFLIGKAISFGLDQIAPGVDVVETSFIECPQAV